MPDSWLDKRDDELLLLVQQGNHGAFGVLVERHLDRFYRLAYRYLQDKGNAEDVVQDAFLKMAQVEDRCREEYFQLMEKRSKFNVQSSK